MYKLLFNSSPILELSVKFASQICNENIYKPLDGAYLAEFGIDISETHTLLRPYLDENPSWSSFP